MPVVAEYPTPQPTDLPPAGGLVFPADGSGLTFDAGYPLTFPSDPAGDLRSLFPSFIPQPEQIVYRAVKDACSRRALFPPDGQGLALPLAFAIPPDVALYPGMDSTYPPTPSGPVVEIPVTRGWPTYPGSVPAIGVAEADTPEDESEETIQAGFAGDVFAYDTQGNVLATASYYAEPLRTTVVVELIHTNRDERDRLHDQLRRIIFPLRSTMPAASSQIRDVRIGAEKQDVPVDEQPIVMYVSLFTVTVTAEALIATEIVPAGVITQVPVTVEIEPAAYPYPVETNVDYT
jgi:hypothetical protein